VRYTVTVKDIQVRVLPELDDELAKDLGEFDSLDALRERVRADLVAAGERDSEGEMRAGLLKQLASRVTFEVPEALVTRDLDRRLEQFVSHLLSQRIDPREANVDWERIRNEQRPAATDTVRSTLMLDEIATRETIEVTDADIEVEIARQAEASGRTASAVRAFIEKEGGLAQVATGLRREKAIALLVEHATIVAV
jgi:trigger factor